MRYTVTMSQNLEQKIEALLFWKGEPVKFSYIEKITQESAENITAALKLLEERLSNSSGLRLARLGEGDSLEVCLVTAPQEKSFIAELAQQELQTDIGKAGIETLTIIAYMGPISRADIEYIRGVQSQFIIRNLLIRGLIEKKDDPQDERRSLYSPTFDLLAHLGITKIEDLPDFEKIRSEVLVYTKNNT